MEEHEGQSNFVPGTVVIVAGKILPVNEQVMVLVKLPELAVDHIEVFVAEEVSDLQDTMTGWVLLASPG